MNPFFQALLAQENGKTCWNVVAANVLVLGVKGRTDVVQALDLALEEVSKPNNEFVFLLMYRLYFYRHLLCSSVDWLVDTSQTATYCL
jgi:hypothetical protein